MLLVKVGETGLSRVSIPPFQNSQDIPQAALGGASRPLPSQIRLGLLLFAGRTQNPALNTASCR